MSNSRMFMLVLFVALVFGTVKTAKAQSGDVYFNIGTATDKSNNQLIDTFGDGNLFPTPAMNGVFGGFGGTFMIRPTIGFGAEYFARFTQGGYAGLNYRPKFYDFNAVWKPLPNKIVVPEFQAGIGDLGAGLAIYVKGGIFVRPQVDVHYVRNFFQFGSNWSPAYSVAIGYTFGRP